MLAILRLPIFTSLFLFAFALSPYSNLATAADCNGASGLHGALLEHDKAQIEFRYKMQTGYIHRAGEGDMAIAQQRNEFLYGGPRRTLDAIQHHLRSVDQLGGAYALVFDPRGSTECVWLVGPDELVFTIRQLAPLAGEEHKFVASYFRRVLNVDVRARNRLPKQRNARVSDREALERPLSSHHPGSGDPFVLRQAVIPNLIMEKIQRSARTLLILPIGDLSAVPFAALPAMESGKYLVDYVSPVVLPSVDGLFFWVKIADFHDFDKAVIVGDPDLSEDPDYEFIPLPGAKEEARKVAQLTNANALMGSQATHDQVLNRLGDRPYLIYLATHGKADANNPMDASFLALRGRHLYAAEIKELRYASHHPLVVMSACQSGLGKTFHSGIFGLARAWIYAGAAQVLASQWNVDDAATAHLMTGFMTSMSRGVNSRQAFRQAMLDTRSEYPDPALWGSFNLFGYPQPEP